MRRALIVGISDFGRPDAYLPGCVPDANGWEALLLERGWRRSHVTSLLDDLATAGNIRFYFETMIEASRPGDTLLLLVSSHGTQLPDQDGDEPDARDEAIVCADALTGSDFAAGCIRDDELARLVLRIPRGVTVGAVLDTCHSGTGTRLLGGGGPPVRPRFLAAPGDDAEERPSLVGRVRRLLRRRRPDATPMAEVLLAACAADQTAADATIDGRPCGAYSHYLQEALRLAPGQSLEMLHGVVSRALARAGYRQTPQLEGDPSHLSAPATALFG